jgi:hypothetical protein
MDENLRTWVWFFSVVMAMTVGPALLGTLFVAGVISTYRRYHGAVSEKVRALRMPRYSHR